MVTFGIKGQSEDFWLSFDLVTDAESVGVIGLSVFLRDAPTAISACRAYTVSKSRTGAFYLARNTHTHTYTNMLLKVSGDVVTILFFFIM